MKKHEGKCCTFGRRTAFRHALVITGHQRLACKVLYITGKDALLEFSGTPPSANRMRLIIDEMGIDASCDVRHRGQNSIGVYFTNEENRVAKRSPDKGGNKLAARLRRGNPTA